MAVRSLRHKFTAIPIVMTTNFLPTIKQPNRDFKSLAKMIK